MFHHIVAALLYVSKRARMDIVSFLCTRVSKSTEEDQGKLSRLLNYLHKIIDMPRIIGADSMDVMQTYVDASYTVHMDMKEHTGGFMILGRGLIQGKANK